MNHQPTIGEWQRDFLFRFRDLFSDSECKQISKSFLEHTLGLSSVELLLRKNEALGDSELEALEGLLSKLAEGQPVQYILGKCFFADLEIELNHQVLIPRPETEELVRWIDQNHPDKYITLHDFCSGSGCIALALKNWKPKWNVVASDYSEEALKQIVSNSKNLSLDVQHLQIDVLNEAFYSDIVPFDILVSNPPYIPVQEKQFMADHVLHYEPEMALFVDNEKPLIFYQNLLEIASAKLNPYGWVYFEIHEDFATAISDLLTKFGFVDIQVKQDLQGRNRMVRGRSL